VAAGGQHTCALLSDRTVRCWGSNQFGQLGDNGAEMSSVQPVSVATSNGAALSGVTAISAGDYFSCALLSDGSVDCWGGYLTTSELGVLDGMDAATYDAKTAQAVTWVVGAAAIASCSGSSTCVVTTSGTVKCWGTALGGGANVPAISDLSGVKAVAPGYEASCALLTAGTVTCWGVWPQGTEDYPTAVPGLTGVTAITETQEVACALSGDGTVACWGFGTGGNLGDGTTAPAKTPVRVWL
jgi:alpha-tubulin suppressor-like RCC1 family protein